MGAVTVDARVCMIGMSESKTMIKCFFATCGKKGEEDGNGGNKATVHFLSVTREESDGVGDLRSRHTIPNVARHYATATAHGND